jgi:intracellular septation protein
VPTKRACDKDGGHGASAFVHPTILASRLPPPVAIFLAVAKEGEFRYFILIGKKTARSGVQRQMRDFFEATKLLLLDLASTIVFLVLFLLTHNTILSVGLGVALGIAQIAIQFVRRRQIEPMEWLSLFLVITAGAATLLTNDPRFLLFKPSVIYAIVGAVMLKPGWLNRYLPPIAKAVVPDVATVVGLAWAGLMFASAAVNAFVVLNYSVATWAVVMPIFGIVSKLAVFLIGFAAMRMIARRRVRAMPALQRDALLASTGRGVGVAMARNPASNPSS